MAGSWSAVAPVNSTWRLRMLPSVAWVFHALAILALARPLTLPGNVYLFTTAVHTSLLGALLTFSGRLWYPLYSSATGPWGLTSLEDQQLAGLIMWVPAGLSYLVAALALAATWLREPAARPVLQPSTLP